jgi:capsular polysaccharide biosynthesis protein
MNLERLLTGKLLRATSQLFHSFERLGLANGAIQCDLPSPFLLSLERGYATFDGAHLSQKGKLIEEVAHEFREGAIEGHRLFGLRSLKWRPEITRLPGVVVSLAGRSSDNFFHWLWDLLPRIHLATQHYDTVYIDCRQPWQRELLKMVGIEQVICTSKAKIIQADQLLVPSYPAFRTPLQPWVREFFSTHFPPSGQASRKLYISRADAKWRKVLNENELVGKLTGLGIEPVMLGSMPIQKQIELFQQAKLIVAPHGAGLANLAFCQPGTRVIEIYARGFIREEYGRQCRLLDLEYLPLDSLETGLPLHPKGRPYDDILADVELTLSAVQS